MKRPHLIRLRDMYQRVDDLIMWKIATRSLPDFRKVIASMISDLEEEQG